MPYFALTKTSEAGLFLALAVFIHMEENQRKELPMTLLQCWLEIVQPWQAVFAQNRTWVRATRQALGSLLVLGRATVSRILWTNGREQKAWSGEYFLHSRAPWEPQALFAPLLKQALGFCSGPLVGVAMDDTRLRKTGRSIPQAAWHRDPLSPPFHTNLMLGLRFLQASLLLPLHRTGLFSARAIPIRFEEVSTVKKPRKGASEKAWQQYKEDRRRFNLSQRFRKTMAQLRTGLDEAGGEHKLLVIAGDGSFCNRTVLGAIPERTVLIVRARKDAKLCFAAPPGTGRVYAQEKFTPEQVRQDDPILWQTTKIFYGGKRRKIRYKEVSQVLWQGGGRRRLLRLFVIAPTAYRKRNSGRLYYRDPAFLLCTDLIRSARQLLQIYFDRWQIEVNHREEKDTLGVGQAQLWNPVGVPKQPALVVAAYSALMLAALKVFGAGRGKAYAQLPRWRRNAKRPSCLDLITLLRKEITEHPELVQHLDIQPSSTQFVAAAAA
jgi:DDE superfamily endonuclease